MGGELTSSGLINPFTAEFSQENAFFLFFCVTMLVLAKICYESTFWHCSNILIEIPCDNVQNFTLVHAHKPKFVCFFLAKAVPNCLLLLFLLFFFLLSSTHSFSLYTSFLLAGKVWTKSSVNPGKETLISSRCVGLFMHRLFTKNGACFFRLALSECSRYTKCTVLWKDLSSLCQLLIWKVD